MCSAARQWELIVRFVTLDRLHSMVLWSANSPSSPKLTFLVSVTWYLGMAMAPSSTPTMSKSRQKYSSACEE